MSRVAITNAIQTYLTNQDIPDLANVYAYPQKFTPEGEFYEGEDPGTSQGAMIFMRLGTQHASRIELRGATGGGKFVNYQLTLTIIYRSSKPKTQDAGADFDTFLDNLLAAIAASKTAGTNDGTVFSWGEGSDFGGEDFALEVFYPRPINNQITQCNARLTLQILAQTTSTATD